MTLRRSAIAPQPCPYKFLNQRHLTLILPASKIFLQATTHTMPPTLLLIRHAQVCGYVYIAPALINLTIPGFT